ncbi:MAG: HAMP domain-containing protein [Alphaproteobacteria bacterium]|nr:HAMP domain-containing protein [Alphaproteobacteria bacterium]
MTVKHKGTSLRTSIIALLLIPLIGVMALAAYIVVGSARTASDMRRLTAIADLSTKMSTLVHDLQRERGASAVFIGSKGTQLVQELPAQRLLTDKVRAEFDTAFAAFDASAMGPAWQAAMIEARRSIDRLAAMRRDISALSIPAPQSNAYFTATIGQVLTLVLEGSKLVTDPQVSNAIAGYVYFLQTKERSGQERATGAPGFAAGRFDPAQLQRLIGVVNEQQTFFRLFDVYAEPAQRDFLKTTVAGKEVDEVMRLRKVALETDAGQPLNAEDGAYWFRVTTVRIDLMKRVEDKLAGDLIALAERIRSRATWELWLQVVASLGIIAFAVVLGMVIVRGLTRGLDGIGQAMGKLAAGDLAVAVPSLERKDEIGQMAKAVQVFKDTMVKAAEMQKAEKAENERREARAKRMDALTRTFDTDVAGMLTVVSDASQALQTTATSMSSTSERTNRQAIAVSAAAEEASTNVQTVASATEQLTASIQEIARQVEDAAAITKQAVVDADNTNAQVQALAEAAQKIGDVLKLISDIAGQTNLLALNATIEAARAGEAGKGFAVVASEVKTLATQTGKATEEIASQIQGIQNATGRAVSAIGGIGKVIGKISDISTAIATAVEQQTAATREIARNVQQASAGTADVSQNISGVKEAANEAGQSSGQVLEAAKALAGQSSRLKAQVEHFLHDIRAA